MASMGRRAVAMAALFATGLLLVPGAAFASETFEPQNDFKLHPWVSIQAGPIDLSINKAVLYLAIASACSIVAFWLLTRNLHRKPGSGQTIIELVYDFCLRQLCRDNMTERLVRRWFPYIATLFIFLWFANVTSYIPLPVNTEEKIGGWFPSFTVYAATANLSVPLALTFVTIVSYHAQGFAAQGFRGYLKSWIPSGVPGAMKVPLFTIEFISHMARIISLSVRLFANMLAGHLLVIMMLGMGALLGLIIVIPFFGLVAIAFYLLEVVLITSLQAFIFAVLSAIYIGESVSSH